eukprot:10499499-Lingulodinium_polyedra.AAC.1
MGKTKAPANDPGRSPPADRPLGPAGPKSDGGDSSTTTDATGAAQLLQKLAICENGAQCRLP